MSEISKATEFLIEQARLAYQFNPSSYTFAALNEAIKLQSNPLIKQRLSY